MQDLALALNYLVPGVVLFLFFNAIWLVYRNIRKPATERVEGSAEDRYDGAHDWVLSTTIQSAYCNICKKISQCDVTCKTCSAHAHSKCISNPEWQNNCKVACTSGNVHQHLWVKGNLHPQSKCKSCHELCAESQKDGLSCAWCQMKIHGHCKHLVSNNCTLGKNKRLIVPPTAVHKRIKLPEEVKQPRTRERTYSVSSMAGSLKSFTESIKSGVNRVRRGKKNQNNNNNNKKKHHNNNNNSPKGKSKSNSTTPKNKIKKSASVPKFENTLEVAAKESAALAFGNENIEVDEPEIVLSPPSANQTPRMKESKQVGLRKAQSLLNIKDLDTESNEENTEKNENTQASSVIIEKDTPDNYCIRLPSDCDLCPLLVFVNPKSGGKRGGLLLQEFRSYLNPIQVCALDGAHPPEVGLRLFKNVPRFRIIVCGGDGTVGWVLQALDKMQLKYRPPIAVLPLGTGNDLARCLGWGHGAPTGSIRPLFRAIENGDVSLLDRWGISLTHVVKPPLRRRWRFKRNNKKSKNNQPKEVKDEKVMNNYFGLGPDALLCLDFHNLREHKPGLFLHQWWNKALYGVIGLSNFIKEWRNNGTNDSNGGSKKFRLECDGVEVDVPKGVEGLLILNIEYFGGGSDIWTNGGESFDPICRQDGLVEVVGVYSTIHLGTMRVGFASPMRLAQCRNVKITTYVDMPMQIDGEPQMQPPSTINFSLLNQAFMLCKAQESPKNSNHSSIMTVLESGVAHGVINMNQRDQLLEEASRQAAGAKQQKRQRRIDDSDRSYTLPQHGLFSI